MKICSLYGAGFYYIPGTDTCLKVGGWVRAETNINSGGSFSPYRNETLDARSKNLTYVRARGIFSFDARSQTEYGTLRSYISGGWQYSQGVPGSVYAPRAFIQWAGFTFGQAVSFFDFYVTPRYSNTTNVWSSDTGGGGDFLYAYTAQFGNGMSATVSAEDTNTRRTFIGGGSAYAGTQWPDIVGNLRIDQAWGSAQIMAAAHQVRGALVSDEVGWAVGAGLMLHLPWGKGDSFTTQVTYGKGATAYVGSTLKAPFMANPMTITDGGNSAIGYVSDAVLVNGSLELTKGWSIVAGADHHWNSQWKTSLYGSYGELSYSAAASAALAYTNADWNMYQVGSRTVWSPVHNLDFSVDVIYNRLNGLDTGVATTTSDIGWWQGIFRVQRNFWP